MKLYIGTPNKISNKIEPRHTRNARGEEGSFIYATPHRKAATAYAFKPTDPELNNAPLLIPEVQQEKTGTENPYAMIIGGDYNLYIRGLSLTGNLYTVPSKHFQPVACPQGEYTSSNSIDVADCQHEVIRLEDVLGNDFNIWFGEPTEAFFTFLDKMIRAHPLEKYGRLVTDPATLEQAVSRGILFKIDNQELIDKAMK